MTSQYHETSAIDTVDRSSTIETNRTRSNLSVISERSTIATDTPHSAVDVSATATTNVTNTTTQIDDTTTLGEPAVNRNSSTSSGNESSSIADNRSFQQNLHPNHTQMTFNQTNINHSNAINQQNFRIGSQMESTTGEQFHYQQQQQVLNPISEQQIFYQYSGSGEPDDVMLYIDYGAIDAYNIAQQSPENLTSGQFLGNFNISEPQFSTVPSPFTQVMTGQDISFRPGEFQQRTQDNIHDFGEQSYSNYQTTTTDYGNKINYAPLYSDTTHEVANILQQSRLGNFG